MIDLVIRLSEEEYDEILNAIEDAEIAGVGLGYLSIALKNGTPLPKGHGALKDADRTIATAWTNFHKHEDEWEKKDKDYLPIGRIYDQNGFDCCLQTIVNAPTIIEADEEVEG